MTPVRVLVADDHATFVRAVTLLLNGDPDIEVVATASTGAEAVERAMSHQPDVVLMDINMPDLNGIEATRQIIDAAPHVAVVALTMFGDDDSIAAMMSRGAVGYLLKGARQEQIRRAVHAAHAGEAILDAPIARKLKDLFAARPPAPARQQFPQLTEREIDILDGIASGLDNASIAARLYLSQKTIRNYVSMVFAKLHVDSRGEAIVLARDAGLGR
jgi:DNA-binding NarL/FixJ family response regulator